MGNRDVAVPEGVCASETMAQIQGKLETVMEEVFGEGDRRIPHPAQHLICVCYGEEWNGSEGGEAGRRLYQDLLRRYRNEEAFQLLYWPTGRTASKETGWRGTGTDAGHWREKREKDTKKCRDDDVEGFCRECLYQVRAHHANGYSANTNVCYVAILFFWAEESTLALPAFIRGLSESMRSDGAFHFRVDLYGLIDYSRKETTGNWERIRGQLSALQGLDTAQVEYIRTNVQLSALRGLDTVSAPLPTEGAAEGERGDAGQERLVQDLYLLSKDGMALDHLYDRAIDAIEMNLYLKIYGAVSDRRFEGLWDWDGDALQGSVIPYECHFKVLSYEKADLKLGAVCGYILKLLDAQREGVTDAGLYQTKVSDRVGAYVEGWLDASDLKNVVRQLPVPRSVLDGLIRERAGSRRRGRIFPGAGKGRTYPSGPIPSTGNRQSARPCVKDVMTGLYGGTDVYERTLKALGGIDAVGAEGLYTELVSVGTYRDVKDTLPGVVRTLLDKERERGEKLDASMKARLKEPVCTDAGSAGEFLTRLYEEVLSDQYLLFQSRLTLRLLEGVLKLLGASSHTERLEAGYRRLNTRRVFLQVIMDNCMPSIGQTMLERMMADPFYDVGQAPPNWGDDVFSLLSTTDIRKRLRRIPDDLRRFADEEGEELLRLFEEEVLKRYDNEGTQSPNGDMPFYLLKGNSRAPKDRVRACFLASADILKTGASNAGTDALHGSGRITYYVSDSFYPYTMEFFALNDSVNTGEVQGLHNGAARPGIG